MTDNAKTFTVKTANEWIQKAKVKPVPKRMFGDFWLEGELSILFSDTGTGKSVLAVQIADAIARGDAIEPIEMTAPAQKVLYLDFELTDKQFEMRYSEDAEGDQEFFHNHYEFSDNFFRGGDPEIRLGVSGTSTSFEEELLADIRDQLEHIGARTLIIDNITYLCRSQYHTSAALLLMKALKKLKNEMGLSMLVLAHTPKRSLWKPLSINDLQGSKHLANFADNIFAIGQSRFQPEYRYLKHIKPRNTELLYDEEVVVVYLIQKHVANFLSFKFDNLGREAGHLADYMGAPLKNLIETAQSYANEGLTQRAIAKKMECSLGSVNRYLQMAEYDD
ncbi:MAG: AAA family ATPase [Pyrinomonadaceae bacterium]